jgi:uncharacterized OB-fold protein
MQDEIRPTPLVEVVQKALQRSAELNGRPRLRSLLCADVGAQCLNCGFVHEPSRDPPAICESCRSADLHWYPAAPS